MSDGGKDLQRHRVYGPLLHLGRVRSSLLQRETSIFYSDTSITGHVGAEPESIVRLLIGTRGISSNTHYRGREKA